MARTKQTEQRATATAGGKVAAKGKRKRAVAGAGKVKSEHKVRKVNTAVKDAVRLQTRSTEPLLSFVGVHRAAISMAAGIMKDCNWVLESSSGGDEKQEESKAKAVGIRFTRGFLRMLRAQLDADANNLIRHAMVIKSCQPPRARKAPSAEARLAGTAENIRRKEADLPKGAAEILTAQADKVKRVTGTLVHRGDSTLLPRHVESAITILDAHGTLQ